MGCLGVGRLGVYFVVVVVVVSVAVCWMDCR